MKIELIRHSKTLVEPQKPIVRWRLSDVGVEKAKAFGEKEIIKDIDVLYSSLQNKAVETAVYLANPNGIRLATDNDFTEITSFTNKFTTPEEGYHELVHDFYHGKIDRIAHGETVEEALQRFNAALERAIAEESKNGVNTLGIVSHGNILACFTAQYVPGVSAYDLHTTIQMPDVATFDWDTKKFVSFWGENI